MKYGLSEEDLNLITGACAELPAIEEVVLFGSRAKGDFKRGSDVDLAVKGADVNRDTVLDLSVKLNQELPLPYFFDVLEYEKIRSAELVGHIDRVGVVIYEGQKQEA